MSSEAHRDPLLEALSRRPESVMARGRVLKHDATTTVVAVRDAHRHWIVKRYNTKNRWHAARRLFRTSRALTCWNAAARLAHAGIDTAAPVAVLEERRLGLRGRSYFICEFIDGETLDSRLQRGDDSGTLVERTARIVQRLREHGIVHGDLKATNFVVDGTRVHLVDLDAAGPASGRRLEAGLKKDLERFLRNWEDRPGLAREFRERIG